MQKKNQVLIVPSPNFPDAGRGLISNSRRIITKETGLPYWGQLVVHYYKERNIQDIGMEKEYSERLVLLPCQPFLDIGIKLYVLGSLSCVATYSNDVNFNGWNKGPKKESSLQNNCRIFGSQPLDSQTIGGLIAWIDSCPIWIESTKSIKFSEKLLTQYFD
jgi:hypothetical protein